MNLKDRLDWHYLNFDRTKLSPDPLEYPHHFSDYEDIELIGFIASVFAYGNVKQIKNSLENILNIFEPSPSEFILNLNKNKSKEKLKGIKHRFYSAEDILNLFYLLKIVIQKNGSLKNLFLRHYSEKDISIKNALSEFSKEFLSIYEEELGSFTTGIKFMFPLPERNSACKRMNLFLRWMVRKDELDFGLWGEIQTNKLIIPVDTHVARICKGLKLTTLKNISWKMAEEITNNLKKFDPIDPVKYDFAICHIGIRKLKF